MSVNLLVRVLTRHKNVDDGKGTKTISSMMSRFFASGSRKKKSTGRRDHVDSADENEDDDVLADLPSPMTEKEAKALAVRIETKLLNKMGGKHGKTYDV